MSRFEKGLKPQREVLESVLDELEAAPQIPAIKHPHRMTPTSPKRRVCGSISSGGLYEPSGIRMPATRCADKHSKATS